jgi:LysR family cyn operon transcriptional activator
MEPALIEDIFDLGIAFSEVRSPEIDCRPLFVEKLSVMVGSGHASKRGVAMTKAELQAESFALLTPDFATRQFIDVFFQAQGIAPHISIEANTIGAIVEIVRRGRLITILPTRVALEHEGLRSILLKPAIPNRTAALLRRRGAYESAAARAFTKLFSRTIAGADLQ